MKILLGALMLMTPLFAHASTDLFGHADPPAFSLQKRHAVYTLRSGHGSCPNVVNAIGSENCEGNDCQPAVEIKELNVTFNVDNLDDTHFHFKTSTEPQDSNDVLNEGGWDYTYGRNRWSDCATPQAHCQARNDDKMLAVNGDLIWSRGVRNLTVNLNTVLEETAPSDLGSIFETSGPRVIKKSGSSLSCTYALTSLKSSPGADPYESLRK